MESREFIGIRHYLGKTQKQLAQLLCLSPKAVQSFEQGWRKIPASAERQLLFLLSSKRSTDQSLRPCWEVLNCSTEIKEKCPAYEFQAGYSCWFITGTLCEGEVCKSWQEKIKMCRECEVVKSLLQSIKNQNLVEEE